MNGKKAGGMGQGNCQGQNQGGQGKGMGRMGGSGQGNAAGYCICTNCGYREPHERAVPCVEKQCPQCGKPMARK